MEEKQIINALSSMLQKRNTDIINLELQIASLTEQLNAAKKEKEEQKDDWKVEIDKSEK
jgi:outer membrane murein-binding lipoprotein Lpp